jgi:succinyl-diaminopimelate desuccinylase
MSIEKRIDELKEELISSTQELLKIKGVEDIPAPGAPFGEGVGATLDCALEISRKLGFKTVNLDGYVGYAEYGDGEEYVGVLGHLDVVPEGEGWIHPPYGAEIHDNKIYARGALDDKGPMMAALFGLKAIKDLSLPLSKKIRIIFGTNEETGSKEMEHYLKYEKPPVAGFTPDADFPIIYAEKGLTIFNIVQDLNTKQKGDITVTSLKGGLRANMVPEYTEAVITATDLKAIELKVAEFAKTSGYALKSEIKGSSIVVKSFGKSAHGSLPQNGENAIMQLFAFIGALNLEKSDFVDFVSFCNKNIGMDPYGVAFGVGLEDKPSGKLSFNAGVVSMSEGTCASGAGAEADKVSFTLNLRYPVTFTVEDMMTPFKKRLEGTEIRIENFEHQEPLYFSEDHPLITTLQRVYTEQTGQEATLLAIGGGTYAKEMPNIVAFGPVFPGQPDIIHQPNECVDIDDLMLCTKIYAKAIYELAK